MKDFTISAKAATVTADSMSKTYGDQDAALTFKTEGLLEGESLSNITVTRKDGENVGTYEIKASQAEGSNKNYAITFKTGTYTIKIADQAAPVVNHTDETYAAQNNGTITDVTDAMEYRMEGTESYTKVAAGVTELTGLSDGTYYVRYAAKKNYNESSDTKVVIKAGRQLTVTIPAAADQIGYTLSSDVTKVDYNETAVLTFTLETGYTATETPVISATVGSVDAGTKNADGSVKYEVTGITADTEIFVNGIKDLHTSTKTVKENEAAPTCTTDGSYDEVVYCTIC